MLYRLNFAPERAGSGGGGAGALMQPHVVALAVQSSVPQAHTFFPSPLMQLARFVPDVDFSWAASTVVAGDSIRVVPDGDCSAATALGGRPILVRAKASASAQAKSVLMVVSFGCVDFVVQSRRSEL
jgi:hypothetical protein